MYAFYLGLSSVFSFLEPQPQPQPFLSPIGSPPLAAICPFMGPASLSSAKP